MPPSRCVECCASWRSSYCSAYRACVWFCRPDKARQRRHPAGKFVLNQGCIVTLFLRNTGVNADVSFLSGVKQSIGYSLRVA
ncbi:hypothetical protein E3J97_03090 [Salmonella enterica]|nr:hypothetical protein [Salmonella enterica]